MPITEIAADFIEALAASRHGTGSLLALDASKRRIGLAGTDPGRRLVTPLTTLIRGRWQADVAKVTAVIAERQVSGLVLGLPLNMDGGEGKMAVAARWLAARLADELPLPILLQDERLTTFAVEEAIADGRLPRPRGKDPLDHYAAAVILEDALRRLGR